MPSARRGLPPLDLSSTLSTMNVQDAFLNLYTIVVKLRSPAGCEWDRKQTPESLRMHLLEEAYETIEAIEAADSAHVCEELGDVLLLVTMLGVIFEERGEFAVVDALRGISEKLIRRHPHVFGTAEVSGSDEIVAQWDRIKVEQEGRREKDSLLDDVGTALPSLERAHKLQKAAAKVGFDWPDFNGVLGKLREEAAEVEEEYGAGASTAGREMMLEEEIGDLLFSAVNVARWCGVDPSIALHRANQKFVRRFKAVEDGIRRRGKSLQEASLEEMDALWETEKERWTGK